jgi:hypothetical protein
MSDPQPPPNYAPGGVPPLSYPPPPPPPPPSTLYSRFKRNPAPLGSLALAVFALVLVGLDHTNLGTRNGAFEGALIAAIVAMIAGGVGLLTAIKFGLSAALLSVAGLGLGLVVLIVELRATPY